MGDAVDVDVEDALAAALLPSVTLPSKDLNGYLTGFAPPRGPPWAPKPFMSAP